MSVLNFPFEPNCDCFILSIFELMLFIHRQPSLSRVNAILNGNLLDFLATCFDKIFRNCKISENTELIQQRAGYDVKLQCNLTGLVDERKLADIKIHWYFKVGKMDIQLFHKRGITSQFLDSNAATTIAINLEMATTGRHCPASPACAGQSCGCAM